MIEKIYKNKRMVVCDNCGTAQECDSWSDVMDFMNYEGWKKKLVYGEWEHYCPECQESEETERRARAAMTWAVNRILEQEKLE